jgi:hypothetical protein
MIKIAVPATALVFTLLLAGLAPAETIKIPADEPVISVNIPEDWEPEATDKGYACESPDKVATVILEVTSEKGLEALIGENVDWLVKDQSVQINKASEQKQDFESTGRKWSRISWDGDSKDWGPATVGFLFTDAGDGKMLTLTYWITKKGQEKHFPTLTKIIESVKRLGS